MYMGLNKYPERCTNMSFTLQFCAKHDIFCINKSKIELRSVYLTW